MSGQMRLRAADALVAPAVAETVANLDLGPADAGTVRLTERLAAEIDSADPAMRATVLDRLGPRLLSCLEALGASPRARAQLGKGGTPRGGGKLDQLRAARSA